MFTNGGSCALYNKSFTARVKFVCGANESLSFIQKQNGCEYEFTLTSKLSCNVMYLTEMKKLISVYLKEI